MRDGSNVKMRTDWRRFVLTLALLLALGGCAKGRTVDEKRYAIDGIVVALDPQAKTATIKSGPIGDWMAAMTMEFPVQPDSEFAKIHPGEHIRGTVIVQDLSYYVTGVVVVPEQ